MKLRMHAITSDPWGPAPTAFDGSPCRFSPIVRPYSRGTSGAQSNDLAFGVAFEG